MFSRKLHGNPNTLYLNKDGKFSNFKAFIGIELSALWDWFNIFLIIIVPIAIGIMLMVSHQHLELIISWVLMVIWLVSLVIDIINCYHIQQHVYLENVDAEKYDKKTLIYCLLGLNIGVFLLVWFKLDKNDRKIVKFPTKIFKHKAKESKRIASKFKKKKEGKK